MMEVDNKKMNDVYASYADLEQFVRNHDSIRMSPRSLSVPRDIRDGFYELVGDVQRSLVMCMLGERVDVARQAARRCAESRQRLLDLTNLATFKLPDLLERFVADPLASLAEPVFGPVLEALQNGRTADELVDAASAPLEERYRQLVRSAYECWAYYGIVADLDPVQFYGVGQPDPNHVVAYETDAIEIGSQQVRSPQRRMPEAVFVTRDGRVFGMKSEAARELDFYAIKIVRRRDGSSAGDTSQLIGHRVLLLYRIKDLASVPVTADREKGTIMPPDLMCEVLTPREMQTPAYVSDFVGRVNALACRRPVQVLTFSDEGAFPAGMLEDASVGAIERTAIGCDDAGLTQIARKLA